jgi:hypothetical protein
VIGGAKEPGVHVSEHPEVRIIRTLAPCRISESSEADSAYAGSNQHAADRFNDCRFIVDQVYPARPPFMQVIEAQPTLSAMIIYLFLRRP